MARLAVVVSLVTLLVGALSAQTTLVSDPQVISFTIQAVTAMTGGAAVGDVTLTGNVPCIAGSDLETGTATLSAKGTESRVDLSLSGRRRSEIRSIRSDGFPQGAQKDISGVLRSIAFHNCWTDASWFFKPLSSLAGPSDSPLIFSYVGLQNRGGTSLQHIGAHEIWPEGILPEQGGQRS